jgi:cation diffusion facilitator CzcD-associated flavoprotein CzcO
MTMRGAGLNVTVLEKADNVGSVWRRHYDRLHLHTDRKRSGLPGMGMPRTYPLYPSREQLIEYLESYAVRFDIRPVFNSTVSCIRRDGPQWRAETARARSTRPLWWLQRG